MTKMKHGFDQVEEWEKLRVVSKKLFDEFLTTITFCESNKIIQK